VNDLIENGVALLEIPTSFEQESTTIPQAAFSSSTEALDLLLGASDALKCLCPAVIDESTDSAHATGYHRVGRMSARYNAHREGFVFSDGQEFSIKQCPSFRPNCALLQELLHQTADTVLDMICRHLELPLGWFQDQLGPTRDHSQWHIKRYVDTALLSPDKATKEPSAICQDTLEWLPTHTDPSLISIVVLNRPGKKEGSGGLQYSKNKQFVDVPWSGHAIAIVFVGSVLQHLTGGYFTACRHRVVRTAEKERMAATLFVRPAPTAVLALPPSPVLEQSNVKVKGNLTFSQWNARVARNYEKAKASANEKWKGHR